MAISRMQQPQQIQSGIGSLQEPRQRYFLGKLVKKAVRGVKKIVKSPLGKAALGIGLGMYAGGLGPFGAGRALSGVKGAGFLRNLGTTMPALFANPSSPQDMRNIGFFPKILNKMTTGQKIFTGLGAAAIATPFIQKLTKTGPYQEIEEEVDEDYIGPYAAMMMARARDPYMNFLPNQQYVQEGFYQPVADGGRIGYASGMRVEDEEDEMSLGLPVLMRRGFQDGELVEEASMTEDIQLPPEAEKFLRQEYKKYVAQGGDLSYPEFKMLVLQQASGEQGPEQEDVMTTEAETIQTEPQMPMMMAEGGIMDLGGMEKDYRAEGGFVPIGKKEKADDVPARLSVNEFVFTADAVRNAGGGDIDKGAEVMENLMDHLEAGGKVSEESQGAQAMYDNMKQLETRVV
jgi:hypothetical protein